MRLNDLTGRKFNKLTVISRSENKGKFVQWNCLCDCGSELAVRSGSLTTGNTKSCGCASKGINSTHGMSQSNEYNIWLKMIHRCENVSDKRYKDYGGRGITVCERWRSFETFYKDMGNKPSSKHSIDRIDNNGNYEPSNCQWATQQQQSRNQRSNKILAFKGKSMCLSEWGEAIGISGDTLHARIKLGWTIEKTLTQPLRGRSS